MPSNRSIYNDAIKKGHNAAWDGQWKKAAEEYRRALAEFPDDVGVRASLAHALEELGQWPDALEQYHQLAKSQPRDPVPTMRIALLQEKLRHPSEAAGSYMAAAELYQATKLGNKAIEAWLRAAVLEPDRADVHQKLIEVYTRGGQHPAASKEYLALARIFNKRGDKAKASSMAQQALVMDPRNETARAMVAEFQRSETPVMQNVPGPVDQAQKAALSRLADTLLEEPATSPRESPEERRHLDNRPTINQIEVDSLIARAVDAQMHHRIPEAIDAYRKLMAAGVVRPEVKFNLGLLFFETMRYDDAIEFLSETVSDPNCKVASHYALGQCYRAVGKMDSAVEHFLQVVKIVDLGSVSRDQADDLISVYEGLAESYVAKGDRAQAESFSGALEEFLTSKGWEDKVQQVRHHLESLQQQGDQVGLVEVIEMPGSDKVMEALALAQEYLRRGKLGAASEECLRSIELAPGYVPAHMRMAEILVKEERFAEANAKYQIMAELCIIRGDLSRAEAMYRSVVKISPEDVMSRSKLIDLLIQQGRNEEVLEEYLALGEMYVRNDQIGKAIEKYTEGMRLATRLGIASSPAATLRHRLAEIRARQGDFKGALAIYQEIHQHSPDDERAHFYVVDLEFRLKQSDAALRDLSDLLARYKSRGEPRKATGVLEALVQSYSNDAGLVYRLAQDYLSAGDHDKAITTLDTLGEAQLAAGQPHAAAETIRHIVELNPPRIEDYKKLLAEIGE